MRRLSHAPFLLLAGWLLATPAPASAQNQPVRGGTATAQVQDRLRQLERLPVESQPARDVRSEFREVLERYPPVLGKMLKLDPGLMSNQAYLAPYPAAWAYLQQHPEIPRDPGFYLEFVNTGSSDYYNNPALQQQQRWRDIYSFVAAFTVVGGIALTLAWIIRFSIGHRRWLRATKMQAELQHKLLERVGSNQELLAYVQSPAGQSLLQALPIVDQGPSGAGLPFSRILWSVQLAFVLAAGGAGLIVAQDSLGPGFSGLARLFGTIGVALGIGFGLAAGASYVLSQKLGVFDANADKMRPFGGA